MTRAIAFTERILMFWGIWLVSGAGLGWWSHILFGRAAVPAQKSPDQTPPDAGAILVAEWLRMWRGKTQQGAQAQPGASEPAVDPAPVAPAQTDPPMGRGWQLVIFFAFLSLVVLLASEPSIEWLPPVIRWLVALILSPRMLALLAGIGIGYLASRYRQTVAACLRDFYAALLGSETKSSWALQSMVAIIALLLIILAINPDLLDKLESFKAGDVEAKFANISNTTRQNRTIANDLTRRVHIEEWLGFKTDFRQGSVRDAALEFDHSDIKSLRIQIRDVLFEGYVEPLIKPIACLFLDNRLERVRSDEGLVRLAIIVRNKVVREAKDGSGATFAESDWERLFALVDELAAKATKIVTEEVPSDFRDGRCGWLADRKDDVIAPAIKHQFDARLLELLVRRAVAKRQTSPDESDHRLAFLDPYFVAAVSDLVALALGQNERANFLVQVTPSYPMSLEYIQPGLINLYYYVSDAKLKSSTPWPLDEELKELDFAMAGATHMINESRKQAAVRSVAGGGGTASSYDRIVRLYLRNRFLILTQYMNIFYERVLSGETLTDYHRQRWAQFYKHAEAVLNQRELGPSLDLKGVTADLGRDADLWPGADIGPAYVFDARVALALSAVMLTEQRNRSTQQACTIARFHLQKARALIPQLRVEGEEARLQAYLSQIGSRISASCADSREAWD